MSYVQIDPPGTWCMNHAFIEQISPIDKIHDFIEIGPGEGKLSNLLCSMGLKGTGIDFSHEITHALSSNMKNYTRSGQYSIIESDFAEKELNVKADLVFSMMVLEHIEDDLRFLVKMKKLSKKNGIVLIGVPARKNKWGIEDDISGHYRRYERDDLLELFRKSDLKDIKIWSVGVPISNLLFKLSNLVIKKSHAATKKELSRIEQTRVSGFKDIQYKTLFPAYFNLLLNKYTMLPFCIAQKFFYNTRMGLGLVGSGVSQ